MLEDAIGAPQGFIRAREIICGALAQCESEKLPTHGLLAAAMTELVPRLVGLYGPEGASLILDRLSHTVRCDSRTATRQ
ncbi:MAG TPA: hypothetical protein VHA35_13315 [Dongiaceae bacterium]|nr:hypothetical protein [Dongiaceae bacterium]